ncbi:MAG: FAD-dependent oxidoreductase [Bacteroidales bacterium]|nr:FAD-dependent oxidoreductase [Bacteroidales bacterium]
MKKLLSIVLLLCALGFSSAAQRHILVEAEQFGDYGGWSLDQQFMEQMGSSYLLAHGAGVPVQDAVTSVELKGRGRYHIYVRTYNWTAPFEKGPGPGAFMLSVGGHDLGPLGQSGDRWIWQYAGCVRLAAGSVELALKDMKGLEGRCDAVLLTTKKLTPEQQNAVRPYNVPEKPIKDAGDFDLVVVGGGYSGICAAVAAARQGLKVALVQDRAVLGGNNSSEIRVQLGGAMDCQPYPNLGNLMKEFAPTLKGNAMPASYYADDDKMSIVRNEPNISLFSLTKVLEVEKNGSRIASVIGYNVVSGERLRFRAPLFADCTGDGTVGAMAGADYRTGREPRSEYGEPQAPGNPDNMVLGASLQWSSKKDKEASSFPELSYGIELTEDSFQRMTKGSWTWETGMFKDQITEAEQIRDYGMLAIYANWSYLKNKASCKDEFAKRSLDWVSFNSGKRESRRLMGDYVLTGMDILRNVQFPDATCSTSWSIDIHYPEPENHKYFPGREFKSVCDQEETPVSPIPYRCLYSRNVDNLFMAGRDISVSHVALASVRVMRTCAMMGEVVGLAAKVCRDNGCDPRGVYPACFGELQALMEKGAGDPSAPNLQMTNVGRNAHHFFDKPLTLRPTPPHTVDPGLPVVAGDAVFEMVFVEGGSFLMGADGRAEFTHQDEKPAHEVSLSSYWIGRYEVTNGLWKAIMKDDAGISTPPEDDNLPVQRRTRAEIAEFCSRLEALTGRHFRLPTEAEWEYAARGGNKSKGYLYSGSDDWADVAWINLTSGGVMHPVGTKLPNELGIYDMSGNAWELCSDRYGPYLDEPAKDPQGPSSGAYCVVRGGGIFGGTNSCRVTYRSFDAPQSNLVINGFRLVMTN